jgi:hypothetical protein
METDTSRRGWSTPTSRKCIRFSYACEPQRCGLEPVVLFEMFALDSGQIVDNLNFTDYGRFARHNPNDRKATARRICE